MAQLLWENISQFLENQIYSYMWPSHQVFAQEKWKCIFTKISIKMFVMALLTVAKRWKPPTCPSIGVGISYLQWTPPRDYNLDIESHGLVMCPTTHMDPKRNLLNKRRLCTKSARPARQAVSSSTGQVHLRMGGWGWIDTHSFRGQWSRPTSCMCSGRTNTLVKTQRTWPLRFAFHFE